MRILVDADACPVKNEILKVAKEKKLEVIMFFDNSHQYEDGYSKVYILDKGADSVDYFLINKSQPGDIIITQDYGVASMGLAKNAYVLHHNGLIYTDDNILSLLSRRALNQKIRKHTRVRGPKKRTQEDNIKFEKSLRKIINSI
jgi:uncharacterized protein YaiI (UPF0178 family)